jgi:hypothetical protein
MLKPVVGLETSACRIKIGSRRSILRYVAADYPAAPFATLIEQPN